MAGQIRPKPQAALGSTSVCNRHPTHRQSPGVCSVCVNERLARLSTASSSSHMASISSSSSLSEASSCSSSEYSSPGRIRASRYARRGSVSFVKRSEKGQNHDVALSKSRSMAAAFVRRVRGGSGSVKENKMSGFWSKVLTRTKRNKVER